MMMMLDMSSRLIWVRTKFILSIYIFCFYFHFVADYPEHLHDEHADYPLAPERLIVKSSILSTTQKENV